MRTTHPSIRLWGVGGQGWGSNGRRAQVHSSPAPRQPTPSPPPASPPPAHCPKEPAPAASGDLGHIGAQRRQGAGLRLRLRRAGRGQGFRSTCTPLRPLLPHPCVVSVGWWGYQGVVRTALPSCVYKCCFRCNRCLCNHLQMCRYPCSLEWINTPRRGIINEK